MAFDPVTLQHLEDALSEAFPYHAGLNAFVSRCGLSATQLKTARDRAEAIRVRGSTRHRSASSPRW